MNSNSVRRYVSSRTRPEWGVTKPTIEEDEDFCAEH